VDNEKRERVRLAQEIVESLPVSAHDKVGLDAGEKRACASAGRYPPRREPVLVTHVRLAPDHRARERRLVGRRPRPAVEAKRCRNEQGEDAAHGQEPSTPPSLRFHRLTRATITSARHRRQRFAEARRVLAAQLSLVH
jgi:hypothetical protein